MPKVLIVFEKFPPYNLSGSGRPFQFAKHLPALGYPTHVIGAEVPDEHDRDDQPLAELEGVCDVSRTNLWIKSARNFLSRFLTGKEPSREQNQPLLPSFLWVSEPSSLSDPHWQFRVVRGIAWRLYWHVDWVCPAVLLGIRTHLRKKFDFVWVSGPHFKNLVAGYWLSVLLRKPLILDIRDPWTYGSLWTPVTPGIAKAELRWAKRILHRAERIVFTSPLTMNRMKQRFPGRPAERMCTITNGFSEGKVEPRRDRHRDKCLFRYIGILHDRRKPDVILKAIREASMDPKLARDVRFQFIGGMGGHERKIDEYGVAGQVENLGRVSRAESVRYMWGSDVNVLLQTITTGQDAVSGKAFEYLASGKPVLAIVSETGGDAWLIRKTHGGTVVPFTEPERVAQAIRHYWNLWRQGTLAQSTRQVDLRAFTWRHLSTQLATVFDEVLKRT